MKPDYGDFLLFIGAVMFLVGLYLILDWRLVLVGGGLLLMAWGSARLSIKANNERT